MCCGEKRKVYEPSLVILNNPVKNTVNEEYRCQSKGNLEEEQKEAKEKVRQFSAKDVVSKCLATKPKGFPEEFLWLTHFCIKNLNKKAHTQPAAAKQNTIVSPVQSTEAQSKYAPKPNADQVLQEDEDQQGAKPNYFLLSFTSALFGNRAPSEPQSSLLKQQEL